MFSTLLLLLLILSWILSSSISRLYGDIDSETPDLNSPGDDNDNNNNALSYLPSASRDVSIDEYGYEEMEELEIIDPNDADDNDANDNDADDIDDSFIIFSIPPLIEMESLKL